MSQEEVERVDTLRYLWQKLINQIAEILSELLQVQPKFKDSLEENVKQFQGTVTTFIDSYNDVSHIADFIINNLSTLIIFPFRKDQWLWVFHHEKHLIVWSYTRYYLSSLLSIYLLVIDRVSLMIYGANSKPILVGKICLDFQ